MRAPGTKIALDTVNPPAGRALLDPILPHLDLFAPSRAEARSHSLEFIADGSRRGRLGAEHRFAAFAISNLQIVTKHADNYGMPIAKQIVNAKGKRAIEDRFNLGFGAAFRIGNACLPEHIAGKIECSQARQAGQTQRCRNPF